MESNAVIEQQSTRYASGIIFHKNKLNLLLWFEKVVLPADVIDASGLDEESYTLLRSSDIMVSEKELINHGLLNSSDVFMGQDGQELPFGEAPPSISSRKSFPPGHLNNSQNIYEKAV